MKRLFVVSTEGGVHEPIYFNSFSPANGGSFRLKVLHASTRSRPKEVVERLIEYQRTQKPGENTEYWALLDHESWSEAELKDAWKSVGNRPDFHLTISNPCFELWLWLHLHPFRSFEDRRHCRLGLAHHWPEYKNGIYTAAPLAPTIEIACQRARALDMTPDDLWTTKQGTRVFRLVEQLLQ